MFYFFNLRNNICLFQSSREHFIDRILWCIQELYSCITNQIDSSLEFNDIENNLVYCMDELLDTVAPLTLFNKNSSVSEVNMDQLKYLVKLLISHVITFKNLALVDDQKSLTEMCQKVNIKNTRNLHLILINFQN